MKKIVSLYMTALLLFFPGQAYTQTEKKPVQQVIASKELFAEGKRLYDGKNYIKARAKFREALDKYPYNKKAKKYLEACVNKKMKLKDIDDFLKKEYENMSIKKDDETKMLSTLEDRVHRLEERKAEELKEKKSDTPSDPKIQDAIREIVVSEPGKAKQNVKQREEQQEPPKENVLQTRESEIIMQEKVEMSRTLLQQADQYYEQLDYKKAFELYKKALQAMDPSE